MPSASSQKRTIVITLITFMIIFIVWFSWMSLVSAKTNWIENKVQTNLMAGIQVVERDAPRIKITNDGGYYVPDVSSNIPANGLVQSTWQEAYEILLVNLNQDDSIPLIKVTSVSLDSDDSSVINAHATVRFEVFPGIEQTIYVNESLPLPHFKSSTGEEVIQ